MDAGLHTLVGDSAEEAEVLNGNAGRRFFNSAAQPAKQRAWQYSGKGALSCRSAH
jgi:hypothetical protein